MNKNQFQFEIRINNVVDKGTEQYYKIIDYKGYINQAEYIKQLEKFFSMRPWLSCSNDYKIIKPQLDNIFNTKKVDLSIVVNDFCFNGKLIIILLRFNIEYFIMPQQNIINIIFNSCNINEINYQKKLISYYKQHHIKYGKIDFKQSKLNQLSFTSHINLKKLKIYTENIKTIKTNDQMHQNFIDLQQFVNLKSVYINKLKNDILLPENLDYINLRQGFYGNRIINNIVKAKVILLWGFGLHDNQIIAQDLFCCYSCKLINYSVNQNIYFSSDRAEINSLTLQQNVLYLKAFDSEIDTLILKDYSLKNLHIGRINKIVIDRKTICDTQKLDLSQFKNLKSIDLASTKQNNIIFPLDVQALKIICLDQLQQIDLSHLKQLQNISISGSTVQYVKLSSFVITFEQYNKFKQTNIQVSSIINDKFQQHEYLANIERLQFNRVDHITIKDQPNDTIDGQIFKGLKDLISQQSPNIQILNYYNLKSVE